jgi:hypothetical protein
MLAELFPEATIDAVEPSPAAFAHLLRNTANLAVEAFNCGVAEMPGESCHDAVVSVAASHHLDTRAFFRACRRLVRPGGLVVVGDEFISPFQTRAERDMNLIAHHWQYIQEAIRNVVAASLPRLERERLERFRRLPGVPSPAEAKALLAEVSHDRIDHGEHRTPWARVRLAVLELEALVAGLDYEVERKTYPANFAGMAEDEQLELVHHMRVRGTDGDHELDAGTHVFCFRRPA